MRVRIATFLVASWVAASPALSENWRASSRAQDAVAYIDVDSIKRNGDRVTFWRELRWPEARMLGGVLPYDRMAALYEGDCKAMTLRSVKLRVSLGDKVQLKDDAKDVVQAAAPGSTAEIDLRSACFGEWPKAD